MLRELLGSTADLRLSEKRALRFRYGMVTKALIGRLRELRREIAMAVNNARPCRFTGDFEATNTWALLEQVQFYEEIANETCASVHPLRRSR